MNPASPPRLFPGVVIAGRYRLESPLARGGMGAVWVARHIELGVSVAVKFMDAAYAVSEAARARFAREARAAAGIKSRHIVAIGDYGVDAGIPYMTMELLRGEDLGVRLRRERRLPPATTAALLAQIAKGLRAAHEAGLVHRDIKPSNIFLAREDDEEVAKILDFGIAKDTMAMFGGEATRTGEVMGSPHYMSPEQVRGRRDLDARSDVWALGVIAFRCLTGRVPFEAESAAAIIAQIVADPIPRATVIAPDLPPAVDAFFARALERDRDKRFLSARELSDELAVIAGLRSANEASSASFARVDLLPSSSHPAVAMSAPLPTPGAVAKPPPLPLQEAPTLVKTPPTYTPEATAAGPEEAPWDRRSRAIVWGAGVVLCVVAVVIAGITMALRAPTSTSPAPAATVAVDKPALPAEPVVTTAVTSSSPEPAATVSAGPATPARPQKKGKPATPATAAKPVSPLDIKD